MPDRNWMTSTGKSVGARHGHVLSGNEDGATCIALAHVYLVNMERLNPNEEVTLTVHNALEITGLRWQVTFQANPEHRMGFVFNTEDEARGFYDDVVHEMTHSDAVVESIDTSQLRLEGC